MISLRRNGSLVSVVVDCHELLVQSVEIVAAQGDQDVSGSLLRSVHDI